MSWLVFISTGRCAWTKCKIRGAAEDLNYEVEVSSLLK